MLPFSTVSDKEGRHSCRPLTLAKTRMPWLLVASSICLSLPSCKEESKKPAALIAPGPAKDGTPVVAMAAGMPISLASLQVIAVQNGYDLSKPDQAKLALRDAVNLELLAAEAKKRGYQEDPDIVRYVKSQSVQKLLLDTVDAPGHQPAQPSDSELKAYYDQHLSEFSSPTVARAQLLALLKRKGQESTFQQKLDAVKLAIESKQQPFGQLVTQFSDDPAAKNYAGITNWLVKGEESKQYPKEILDAVFSAKDLVSIAGPIEHNDWVYFVKVAERKEGVVTPFKQAKSGIASKIHRAKRLEVYDRYVSQLSEGTEVVTYPEKVAEALKATATESGPPMGPVTLPKK